jgi:hypothetical protein
MVEEADIRPGAGDPSGIMAPMDDTLHRSTDELERGLAQIEAAPADVGTLDLIVRRPAGEEREVLTDAVLDVQVGVEGDNWLSRGSRHTEDGTAENDRQVTLMNSRAVALIAGTEERWPLAGDQLYVDLNLGEANLPTASLLELGHAVLEVTAPPHTGCAKFTRRFGRDAARFVNSDAGRVLNLRGINARVVTSGTVSTGASVQVIRRGGPADA